jgi:hypothetical protein
MAFDEDEVNQLKLVLMESTQDIRQLLNTHHTTIFGANNNNGLNGDMKHVKDRIESLNTEFISFKRGIVWASTAVSGAIGTLSTIATHLFTKH